MAIKIEAQNTVDLRERTDLWGIKRDRSEEEKQFVEVVRAKRKTVASIMSKQPKVRYISAKTIDLSHETEAVLDAYKRVVTKCNGQVVAAEIAMKNGTPGIVEFKFLEKITIRDPSNGYSTKEVYVTRSVAGGRVE